MNEEVQAKVGTPGAVLAAFGALTMLLQCLGGLVGLLAAMGGISAQVAADVDPATIVATFLQGSGSTVIVALLGMPAGLLALIAGLRLRSAKSAGLVYAGAIVSMLPCCSGWCCVVGFFVGIWVIMTMRDEQVREAFAA